MTPLLEAVVLVSALVLATLLQVSVKVAKLIIAERNRMNRKSRTGKFTMAKSGRKRKRRGR